MRGKTRICLVIGMVLMSFGSSWAEIRPEQVEFSGFADVMWQLDGPVDSGEDFAIGQAEIDLAATVGDRINLEMALAYDPESGNFGLGALVMELALLGQGEHHFHHSEIIENAGVVIGQMDVPFGIDWMFYPSLDRQFITGPMAVSGTHGGWNDLGVSAFLETSHFNGIICRLNGTGYEPSYLPEAETGAAAGSAWSARLGTKVYAGLELGGSLASISTEAGDHLSALWGLDAQWAAGPLSAKGEYIKQSVAEDSPDARDHTGSYLEAMFHPDSCFLLARYGIFDPDGDLWSRQKRLCLGAGYVVQPGAELRFEQQLGLDDLEDRSVAQFVVGF